MGEIVVGGIEGGATHSTLMLFNGQWEPLATIEGPGSNLYQLGMEETCTRLRNMVKEGLEKAGLNRTMTLESLGLSLSGCEREETNQELVALMRAMFPNLAKAYAVCSDTVGTLAAASDNGGIVLIAGTGSNCLLINPNGSTARCGGWGHLLGDEGSAFWIAQKAAKTYFDHLDRMETAPYDVTVVKNKMLEYFEIKTHFDLLTFCYDKFVKAHFAGLTKELAAGADGGDQLCAWLFSEAGRVLARHVIAVADDISTDLRSTAGGVPLVCIGSVWKSWKHLQPGFVEEFKKSGKVKEVSLLKLEVGMATGAAYLGAKEAKLDLPKDFSKNSTRFGHILTS